MVAVFNKDVLSWYLITVKLKETVDANLNKSSPPGALPLWQALNRNLPLLTNGEGGAGGEALPPRQEQERERQGEVQVQMQSPAHSPKPQDPEWVVAIRGKLAQARAEEAACPWARLSVYRVPKSLRDGDERAYMPQVVSIGPLHRGRRRLREMERHKWRALHHVLKRTGHDVTAYLDALRPMEERARACYDGRVAGMQGNELVECLVLDGTFVLELFRGALDGGKGFGEDLGYSQDDPIFAMRDVMHAIRNDMAPSLRCPPCCRAAAPLSPLPEATGRLPARPPPSARCQPAFTPSAHRQPAVLVQRAGRHACRAPRRRALGCRQCPPCIAVCHELGKRERKMRKKKRL